MGINADTVVKALSAIGPVTAAIPEFAALFHEVVGVFDSKETQDDLKAAYEDAITENEAGHSILQAKLAAAAKES